jgi:hypothetical protein
LVLQPEEIKMRDENKQLNVEELVRAHFDYSASNPGKWAELLADDASWEFPYGDAVGLKTLEGKPAMVNLVSTFMEPLRDYAYGKPSIHLLPDGSSAVAEFSGQELSRPTAEPMPTNMFSSSKPQAGKSPSCENISIPQP